MLIQTFIDKFTEQLIDNKEIITNNTRFREIDGWDSMTGMVMIIMVEETYGLKIEVNDFKKLHTIQEFYDYIIKRIV